jgi:hypothetical protein
MANEFGINEGVVTQVNPDGSFVTEGSFNHDPAYLLESMSHLHWQSGPNKTPPGHPGHRVAGADGSGGFRLVAPVAVNVGDRFKVG